MANRIAVLGLGIRKFERGKGRLPEDLNELIEVDIDPSKLRPLGGRPYGYRKADDGEAVLWGIDRTGKQVVRPMFTSAQPFQDGVAAVGVKELEGANNSEHDQELIGFIDRSGKFVIQPQYNDATEFSDGRCLVHRGGYQPVVFDAPTWWEGGQWLLIDKAGNVLAVTEIDRKR